MNEIGTVYKDDRDIYIVLWDEGEAYYFEAGAFHQGLTRFATKGCKIKDIEELMPPEEAEGLK